MEFSYKLVYNLTNSENIVGQSYYNWSDWTTLKEIAFTNLDEGGLDKLDILDIDDTEDTEDIKVVKVSEKVDTNIEDLSKKTIKIDPNYEPKLRFNLYLTSISNNY